MSSSVPAIALSSSLPDTLRNSKAWLVWKFLPPLPDKTKPRKVPYYPISGAPRYGNQGSDTDRAGLVTLEQAQKIATTGYNGVGLAMLDDLPYCAVDFDNCLNDGKLIRPELRPILKTTYCEISPSGKGLRLIYAGKLGIGGSIKNIKGGVELFDNTGFVTVTGRRANKVTVSRIGDEQKAILKGLIGGPVAPVATGDDFGSMESIGRLRKYLDELPDDLVNDRDSWLRVGMALHASTSGSEIGKDLWDKWSQKSVEKYGGIDDAWKSFKVSGNAAGAVGAGTLAYLAQNPPSVASRASSDGLADPLGVAVLPIAWPPISYLADPTAWHLPPPPKQALFDNLMPSGELAALAGAAGAGKSWLTLQMAASLATGFPLCGQWIPAAEIIGSAGAKVLMLNAEDNADDFWRRTHALAHVQVWGEREWAMFKRNVHIAPVAGREKNFTKILNGVTVAHVIARQLAQAVSEREYRLVVVDPAIYFRVGDENDAMAQAAFMDALAPACADGKCTVLVVQHVTKDANVRSEAGLDDMRGSTALGGAVRWAAVMRTMTLNEQNEYPVSADQRREYVRLNLVKNSHGPVDGYWLRRAPASGALAHSELRPVSELMAPPRLSTVGRPSGFTDSQLLARIMQLPDQTQAELANHFAVTQSCLSRRLKTMQRHGILDQNNRPIIPSDDPLN